MRYTLFFTYSLFPLWNYLLPAPCSLKPRYLYLMGIIIAILSITVNIRVTPSANLHTIKVS
ncbi:MAG: hypothetical protein F6K65_36715 [Moorea sp. SIO3C2]|nr:hypothetical protein [Moorena sp. SIO3C2]